MKVLGPIHALTRCREPTLTRTTIDVWQPSFEAPSVGSTLPRLATQLDQTVIHGVNIGLDRNLELSALLSHPLCDLLQDGLVVGVLQSLVYILTQDVWVG